MTECPVCHKTITDPGYEFGTEFKQRCLTCSCGAHVIVSAEPPEVLREKLKKIREARVIDKKILASTKAGLSHPYIKKVIKDWVEQETKSGSRHCMEDFLTRIVVYELRRKLGKDKDIVRTDKLGVGEGRRCDFKIDGTDYRVEIEKSLTGQLPNLWKPIGHHLNCNPFLLISLTGIDTTELKEKIKTTYPSEKWDFEEKVLSQGVALLAKKLNQRPYSFVR